MQLKKVVNHGNIRWRVSANVEGKRKQRFFPSRWQALEWIKLLKVDDSCINFWSEISTEEQRDIISAYKLASSKGLSLYRCLLQSPSKFELKPITISAAVLKYEEIIHQKSLRPESLKQTQLFLGYLVGEFGNESVQCVSSSHLEMIFQKRNWQRSTIDGVIAKIGPFFSWLVREGFIDKSPCRAIRRPIRDNSKPPSILSVKAANELLYVAQRRDPEFAKYFAIGLFAGVRPHEIERLDEKDITERYIEISAANAKCRKRRLVNVMPNLKEWLKVSPKTPLKNKRRRKLALIKAADISWSNDIMRHSYASYHLAHFCSADKTALEMGHRDTNMLFRHYRQLVTMEAAEGFWAIRP
jgi:integrase